jgi:hypothetical protein
MTRERDIEHVVEQWFAEGPTQMPDRLFNAVIDRIDRVPQRRLARLQTRLLAMNFNIRLAAAAAVIVAVAGVGAFMLTRPSGVGVVPSPTPALSPLPSPTLAALPAALRYKWVGAPRTAPEIDPPISCSRMLLGTFGTMEYNGCGPRTILLSNVALATPATVQFTLVNKEQGCSNGDVGSYSFVLTPNGKTLSLTKIADACAARVSAISGDWNRSDCPDKGSPCLGDLDAGTHVSANFSPFQPGAAWVANYAALSYTVPEGWANIEDCDVCYALAEQGAPEGTTIYLWSDVAAHLQDDACTNAVAPGVGRSASAITAWLGTLPGLATTPPQPISLGGLSGFMLDLSVAPSWTHTCSYSNGDPVVPLFTDPAGGGFDWGTGGAGHDRIILLDLGDGRALLIDLGTHDKAEFDALLPKAMEVINSFQFSR